MEHPRTCYKRSTRMEDVGNGESLLHSNVLKNVTRGPAIGDGKGHLAWA